MPNSIEHQKSRDREEREVRRLERELSQTTGEVDQLRQELEEVNEKLEAAEWKEWDLRKEAHKVEERAKRAESDARGYYQEIQDYRMREKRMRDDLTAARGEITALERIARISMEGTCSIARSSQAQGAGSGSHGGNTTVTSQTLTATTQQRGPRGGKPVLPQGSQSCPSEDRGQAASAPQWEATAEQSSEDKEKGKEKEKEEILSNSAPEQSMQPAQLQPPAYNIPTQPQAMHGGRSMHASRGSGDCPLREEEGEKGVKRMREEQMLPKKDYSSGQSKTVKRKKKADGQPPLSPHALVEDWVQFFNENPTQRPTGILREPGEKQTVFTIIWLAIKKAVEGKKDSPKQEVTKNFIEAFDEIDAFDVTKQELEEKGEKFPTTFRMKPCTKGKTDTLEMWRHWIRCGASRELTESLVEFQKERARERQERIASQSGLDLNDPDNVYSDRAATTFNNYDDEDLPGTHHPESIHELSDEDMAALAAARVNPEQVMNELEGAGPSSFPGSLDKDESMMEEMEEGGDTVEY
ncbi:hypothetical protein JAAARDRAFT_51403 [Jaapia argillacea MUCL 33604]|uniref:Uncharacterized protein n=1 Tax=Jaapia argillacea MUCL 33604 TaxID=933084 RepID=A0A067PGG5_9AGAM|nr:hypothetical protein JAAARDRAFT_51403 [Jaapia argillacea MUCL 33604]